MHDGIVNIETRKHLGHIAEVNYREKELGKRNVIFSINNQCPLTWGSGLNKGLLPVDSENAWHF